MVGIKVTGSQEQVRMGPNAQTIRIHVVWVETDSGATGQLEVPAAQWNPDDLAKLLEAKRNELDLAFTI